MTLLLALILLFLPVAAFGQQAEEPTPFERDVLRYRSIFEYGGFTPDLSTILPTGTRGRWTLRGGVEGTYTDNLDQDAAKRDAFYLDGTAGLGWLKLTPRFQGSLDYGFRTDLYESEAVSGEDHTAHRVTGALGWAASPHWNLSAGGHFAQDLESGVEERAPGVRSTYNNRFNEYGFHGRSEGQLSRSLSNETTYEYRYRKYQGDGAEGENTRSQLAGTDFGVQATARDGFDVGYEYAVEDNLTAKVKRQNHFPSATWSHRFLTFPANRSSTLAVSYRGDRAFDDEGPDYWNHTVEARYETPLSPRTSAYGSLGYQWILPEYGGTKRGVRYGGGGEHRFSEYTTLRVSASHGWEYALASSRSDFTTLTRLTRASVALDSRLSEELRAEVSFDQEQGAVDSDISGGGVGDFWQTRGRAALTVEVDRSRFVGVDYSVVRRSTDESEDDYLLQDAGFFVRTEVFTWMYLTARYNYENRDYDRTSTLRDYYENRVTFGLTVQI